MKFAIFASAAALSLCAAGAALAQETGGLTDSQFVRANRCLGLASSTKLDGAADASAFATKLKAASKGRASIIVTRGDEARTSAKREADRVRDTGKAALTAERDGAECQGYQS